MRVHDVMEDAFPLFGGIFVKEFCCYFWMLDAAWNTK